MSDGAGPTEEGSEARGKEGDRRRAILRAAVEVFAQKGYHGCRIADVARQADVAYGLVYHYFRNKEELLQSVFAESFGRFSRRVEEIAQTPGTTAEKVGQIASFAVEAFRQDPRAVRVLILEIARSPAFRDREKRGAFVEAIRVTAEVLKRGQEKGEVRPGLDPFVAASVLFGAIEVVLTNFVLGNLEATNEAHLEAARRGVLEIFLNGVAPASPAPHAADAEGDPWKPPAKKSATKSRAPRRS